MQASGRSDVEVSDILVSARLGTGPTVSAGRESPQRSIVAGGAEGVQYQAGGEKPAG